MFFIRRKDNLAKLMSYVLGSAEPQGAWTVGGTHTLRAGDESARSLHPNVNSNPFSVKVCTSPGSSLNGIIEQLRKLPPNLLLI